MLYREIIAVCSQIHTKHINTLCGQNVEFVNVKLAVPIPVAARSKAARLLSCGFECHRGHGCLLRMLCVVRLRSLRRADHSSRGALPTMVRSCVRRRNEKALAHWEGEEGLLCQIRKMVVHKITTGL